MAAPRNGARRFVTAERKSFDLSLEGLGEDVLRITENGHRRRTSVVLRKQEMRWLGEVWKEMWQVEGRTRWFRQRRDKGRTVLFQVQKNRWGRIVVLSVLEGGVVRMVVCREGIEKSSWRDLSNVMAELVALSEVRDKNTTEKGQSTNVAQRNEGRTITRIVKPYLARGVLSIETCCPSCGISIAGDCTISGSVPSKKVVVKMA